MSIPITLGDVLIGRTAECARLQSLLGDARQGNAGVLVLRGEAGMGKTRLLDFAVERAEDDFQTLGAAGHEAETGLSFAGLAWLLDPVVSLLPGLPEAQAGALAGALQIGPAAGGDRLAVAAATLTLLATAADSAPLLVTVDDAHLLDLPSLEALVFAVRRLKAERIAVLLTARPREETSPDVDRWLDSLPELTISGLDDDSARRLLDAYGSGMNRSLLDRRVEEAGGNPLALLEFPRIGETASPVVPLPIGRRLEMAFSRHIKSQPQTTRQAMLLVATAGAAVDDILGPALNRQGLSAEDLEPAEEAGLLAVDRGSVRFRHPLVRSALYHAASPVERRAAHRLLADLFGAQEGARAAERRGWHLAEATLGPDEDVAAELDFSAFVAAERRSYATAMDLCRWSARLGRPGEPRAGRLLRAAHMSLPAGRADLGRDLLRDVLAETEDQRTRTEARHLECRIEMWRGNPVGARDLVMSEAERIEADEPLWAAYMRSNAALVSVMLGEPRRAAAIAERAEELVAGMPEQAIMPVLLLRALTLAIIGEVKRARDLLTVCTPHLEDWDPLDSEQLLLVAALAWESLEEPGQAHRWLSRAVRAARDASAIGLLPFQLSQLTMAEWRAGRWTAAYAHGHDAIEVATETGWHTELPNGLVALATVDAGIGRREDCQSHLARAVELAAATGTETIKAFAGAVLGLLELGDGRPAEACRHLEFTARFAAGRGIGDTVLMPWAGNLVEARVRAGRLDQAREPYEIVTAEAGRTGRPTQQAIALRCRGLLGDGSPDEAFASALEWHARASQPFEEARTRLCYGEHLRRQRRRADARASLERAAAQFEELGARVWADRSNAELRATGVTARSRGESAPERLTPQELQVALAVAEGASNAEAAAQLFLSPKTIEYHLSRVYRKLGLRSRSQLARAMSAEAIAAQ